MENNAGFLPKIADQFIKSYSKNLYRVAFVFPTRRAGIYFKKYLQKSALETIWAPAIFSIKDFINRLSQLNESDHLELIFELYKYYKKADKNHKRTFEDFYLWGKMIISDFNEIDKNLIDTKELFRNLREFQDIENLDIKEKPDIYKKYVGIWGDFETLYNNFKTSLKKKNKAYEGMIIRDIAENIKNPMGFQWEKVIFCGFNAFTRAEEKIIGELIDTNQAEIYWDMDRYFVDNDFQEAGHFFRRNRKTFEKTHPAKWIDDYLMLEKKINIIGVQSRVSQAKVLGLQLKKMEGSVDAPENIAIVLPDETMLFPVLNSLPESFEKVNITLGFPLKQTPTYSLFNSIIEMYLRTPGNQFYYRDILKLLNHPYIKPISPEEIILFSNQIKEKNQIIINNVHFKSTELNMLFEKKKNSREIIPLFLNLLDSLREFYSESTGIFLIDLEFIYHFYILLTKLKDSLSRSNLNMDIQTFWKLFNDIVEHTRIPFTGEPLEGLQIMGMLETQTLSFNHVFVLSVNEGILPIGKTHKSLIPYDIRKIIGLPTTKDRDAISAYHFYRLLKQTQQITLIYTAETRGIEKNEKSRFIDQILMEYADENKNATINHQIVDFSFEIQKIKKITIKKSKDIIDQLSTKRYSASSLLTYMACPLKFYFTYILNLKEEESVFESPDYKIFGNIVHKTLEKIYKPFINKTLTSNDFNRIGNKNFISNILEQTYKKESNLKEIHTGRNKIVFEVMKEYLFQFFEKERKNSGFKILGLEKKISNVNLQFNLKDKVFSVKLRGFIDRLDFKDNKYRIIDYKTGEINSLHLNSIWELTEKADKKKEAFQLLFYWYLLKKTQKANINYRLGIYHFKNIYDDLKLLKIGKSDIITQDLLGGVENIIKNIFQKIFDLNISFSQTEEKEKCLHCPFIHICN